MEQKKIKDAVLTLIKECVDAGKDKSTLTLTGVKVHGEKVGVWKITVEKKSQSYPQEK